MYDCESSARLIRACPPGYFHLHDPNSGCHPNLQNSGNACPSGPVVFRAGVVSHTACMIVWGVPLVHACCACQHSLRYGITMVGATRCPGTWRAKTISLDRKSLLGPHTAYMTVDSNADTVFFKMLTSYMSYNTAAMMITAAMAARPSNPRGSDLDFFGAVCASGTRFARSGLVHFLGCMRTPMPSCWN